MKTIKTKRICALLLCLIMMMSLLSVAAMAESEEDQLAKCIPEKPIVARVVETTTEIVPRAVETTAEAEATEVISEFTNLSSAVDKANSSEAAEVRIEILADCSITGTTDLYRSMSIIGIGTTKPVVTVGGSRYGFRVGKGDTSSNFSFTNLNLKTVLSLSCISIQAYRESKRAIVNITNCTLTNTLKTAIDLEGTDKTNTNYFDLSIKDCKINAAAYGIGSGLDNNAPEMATSTISVTGTEFNVGDTSSKYCIHCPKMLKSLIVSGCTFNNSETGIKYQFKGSETNVLIRNNDFRNCRVGDKQGYCILATNHVIDLKDSACYCWATELSGNNFCGQNVLILAKAPLEVIWFPDGQATNNTIFNNLANSNTTDSGTRYTLSSSSVPKVHLTDFNITDSALNFLVGSNAAVTTYYYNSKTSSGAYTNSVKGLASYWTDTNQAHCSSELTDWSEANAITRWKLGDTALTQDKDKAGKALKTFTAENSIAKVVIDTATGKITVTPKAVGSTTLTATVGGGAKGDLPNAKSDTLTISVGTNYIPPYVPTDPSDVTRPELNRSTHKAYISGYPEGTVHPEALITRAEVAMIFYRLLTDASIQKYLSYNNSFKDVAAGDWYNEAVSTLTNAGVLKGYPDNSFRPNDKVTRAELTTIVTRFYNDLWSGTKDAFTDISSHWARFDINLAAELKLVSGYPDGSFKPDNNVSRAEAITIINNTLGWSNSVNNSSKYTVRWTDNANTNTWYYIAIQEATNSY